MNTVEVLDKGMNCLLQNLGTIETERFIAALIRERFDYTEWRKGYFGDTTVSEMNRAAVAYARNHPFESKKAHTTTN